MAIYKGKFEQHFDYHVLKDGVEISARNWMPAGEDGLFGFSWGHAGMGAHRLAMAILIEEGFSVEDARSLHHSFCLTVIAMLDSNTDWEFNSNQFQKVIDITIDANRKMGRS